MIRPKALLVTPLPPLHTGLATYAMRILTGTSDLIDWHVAYTPGSDPGLLPEGMTSEPVSELDSVPDTRVFQLGNSPDCFPVLRALYRFGGTGLFHEVHLHHMIRHCCLERGMLDHYRDELRTEYGPSAELVERVLSRPSAPAAYDRLLKRYPLIAMAVNACSSTICLNASAGAVLEGRTGRTFTVGHPLSPLPGDLRPMEKPGDPVIGMAGGFSYGRNLDSVVEAVDILRRRNPDAALLLVGGGYPEPEKLPEWVHVTGRLPENEYQRWIRTMDIAADLRHPPMGETSGSLLEVMRAGIPSVVAASGALVELPSDAVLRIPPDHLAGSTAAALEMLLRRPELRSSMSRAAVAWAGEQGSRERMRTEWTGIVGDLLTGSGDTDSPRGTGRSMSSAWHDQPEGFTRDCSGSAVTWKWNGRVQLVNPGGFSGAWVTARGEGSVSGSSLSSGFRVITVDSPDLVFEGSGEVSCVYWLEG